MSALDLIAPLSSGIIGLWGGKLAPYTLPLVPTDSLSVKDVVLHKSCNISTFLSYLPILGFI